MKTKPVSRGVVCLLAGLLALAGGCSEWRYEVTEKGVAFNRVRTDTNGGLIGFMPADTVIAGRPCKQGWVHLHANGVPSGFTAARAIDVGRFVIPADTWVFQNDAGIVTVCAFPRDVEIQGHVCRGSGGPKGVQAAFYPSGALKQYYLRNDTRLQGVLCDSSVIASAVELHENGRVKSCVLAEDLRDHDRVLRKGARVHFDADGRVQR